MIGACACPRTMGVQTRLAGQKGVEVSLCRARRAFLSGPFDPNKCQSHWRCEGDECWASDHCTLQTAGRRISSALPLAALVFPAQVPVCYQACARRIRGPRIRPALWAPCALPKTCMAPAITTMSPFNAFIRHCLPKAERMAFCGRNGSGLPPEPFPSIDINQVPSGSPRSGTMKDSHPSSKRSAAQEFRFRPAQKHQVRFPGSHGLGINLFGSKPMFSSAEHYPYRNHSGPPGQLAFRIFCTWIAETRRRACVETELSRPGVERFERCSPPPAPPRSVTDTR